MAFKRCASNDGAQSPFEYLLLTDNEGATLGEALVQISGRLTKCGATVMPEFIAMQSRTAESTSVKPLAVVRINDQTEYETQSMATVAATLVGNKVTLHTDGLLVTATATSGNFKVSATNGATTTSTVRGYFKA